MFLREIAQLGLAAISLIVGSRAVRAANKFNYHAITEVAVLFFGIFLCMQPALQILNIEGSNLGVNSPAQFHWYTGSLSAVLDSAPTNLIFFKTAQSLRIAVEPRQVVGQRHNLSEFRRNLRKRRLDSR